MILFDQNTPVTLCVDSGESQAVRLAAKDLLRDAKAVSGFSGHTLKELDAARENSVIIGTLKNCKLNTILKKYSVNTQKIAGKWEHYIIQEKDGALFLIGSDERGTMWAVYECSRRILGVDPMYLFTDHEPIRKPSIVVSGFRIVDGPRDYRFRGWFINDEDLIMGYCRQGRPEKDYDFHQDYAPMLSMIVETALRMKQNLLIPASHIDMDDPAQEALVKLVTDRGLFISMHHQEPVGVNQQRLDRWFKSRGDDTENLNYVDHPEKYRQIWRHFIRKWAQYPNVIWQLGLRGRGDRPVWYQNDRIPDTLQARGALISEAIRDQWRIIAEETGREDFLCSSTLWMEGMPLYRAGTLQFPKNAIIVLSDFGPDQMWGREYDETPRRAGASYGVYYHVCFWGCGPHLVQGNRPEKILYNYSRAFQMGDTTYSILNVSNIREHVLGISTVAKCTWHFQELTPQEAEKSWCRETLDLPDEKGAAELYTAYFDAFSHLDDTCLPGRMLLMDGMCKRVALMLMKIMLGEELQKIDIQNKRLFDFPSTDAFIAFYMEATAKGIERFEAVSAQARAYLPQIPKERRVFFQNNLILQLQTILSLYQWVNALCKAAKCRRTGEDAALFRLSGQQSVLALQSILEEREKGFSEKWRHWWAGDTLIDAEAMIKKTMELLDCASPGEKIVVL